MQRMAHLKTGKDHIRIPLVIMTSGDTDPLTLERLMLLLGGESQQSQSPDVVVISQGADAEALAVPVARQLRQLGHAVEVDLSGAGFGKQLKRAGKSGARWAVLIGDEEASSGQLQRKDLNSGESSTIALQSLAENWIS